MILCVRVRGVRLELNFTKIGGYGDTEIRKRPCGEGGKREGRGRAKMVDTEIRVQDTEIPRYTTRQDVQKKHIP